MGVAIGDIDSALNNAFSQRQISTIYSARNQYRVVIEANNDYARDPAQIANLHVTRYRAMHSRGPVAEPAVPRVPDKYC